MHYWEVKDDVLHKRVGEKWFKKLCDFTWIITILQKLPSSLESSLGEQWQLDGLKVMSGYKQADAFQFPPKLEDQLNQNVTWHQTVW